LDQRFAGERFQEVPIESRAFGCKNAPWFFDVEDIDRTCDLGLQ
jgi:hypothetical protein